MNTRKTYRSKNVRCFLEALLVVSFLVFFVTFAFAKDQEELSKVMGQYQLKSLTIDSKTQLATLSFQAADSSKNLIIDTQQVHNMLKQGESYLIEAELTKNSAKANMQVATQILIKVAKKNYGYQPVWIVSHTHPPKSLGIQGSYLKMHAPVSDFVVF